MIFDVYFNDNALHVVKSPDTNNYGRSDDPVGYGVNSQVLPIVFDANGAQRGSVTINNTKSFNEVTYEMWIKPYATAFFTAPGAFGTFDSNLVFNVGGIEVTYDYEQYERVHLVLRIGTSVDLFINGELVDSQEPYTIMQNTGGDIAISDSIFDAVAVYDYILTDDQVVEHYNAGTVEVGYEDTLSYVTDSQVETIELTDQDRNVVYAERYHEELEPGVHNLYLEAPDGSRSAKVTWRGEAYVTFNETPIESGVEFLLAEYNDLVVFNEDAIYDVDVTVYADDLIDTPTERVVTATDTAAQPHPVIEHNLSGGTGSDVFVGAGSHVGTALVWAQGTPTAMGSRDGAVLRTNLATNPAMESTSSENVIEKNYFKDPYWVRSVSAVFGTGATGTQESLTDENGEKFSRATWTAPTSSASTVNTGINLIAGRPNAEDIVEGESWSVQIQMRTNRSGTFRLYLQFLDATNANIGNHVFNLDLLPDTWTDAIIEGAVVPAGATSIRILSYGWDSTRGWEIGDTYDIRRIALWRRPIVHPFFYGGTWSDDTFSYRWSGDADSSYSEKVGLNVLGLGGGNSYKIQTVNRQTNDGHALALYSTYTIGFGSGYTQPLYDANFVDGQRYRVSVDVWLEEPLDPGNTTPKLQYIETGTSGSVRSPNFAPDRVGEVVREEIEFVADPAATGRYLRLYNGGRAWEPPVYFDNLLVEPISAGDPPSEYFDGDSGATDGVRYRWTGTEHLSSSEAVEMIQDNVLTVNSIEPNDDQWTLHYMTVDSPGALTITNDGRLMRLTLFEEILTTDQINTIHESAFGNVSSTTILDTISLTEFDPALIQADWTVVTIG